MLTYSRILFKYIHDTTIFHRLKIIIDSQATCRQCGFGGNFGVNAYTLFTLLSFLNFLEADVLSLFEDLSYLTFLKCFKCNFCDHLRLTFTKVHGPFAVIRLPSYLLKNSRFLCVHTFLGVK